MDLITLSVAFFGVIRRVITANSVQVAIQVLEMITESMQGPCRANQIAVVDAKFLESAAAVLRQEYWDGVPVSKVKQLKHKCVETLIAILEGSGGVEARVPQMMAGTITLKTLKDNLRWVLCDHLALHKEISVSAFPELSSPTATANAPPLSPRGPAAPLIEDSRHGDGSLSVGFKFYTLLMTLADQEPTLRHEIFPDYYGNAGEESRNLKGQGGRLSFQEAGLGDEITDGRLTGLEMQGQGRPELPSWAATYNFFAKHCKHVEVLRSGKLHRMYFPVLPMCSFITDEAKERVISGLRRTTPETKVADLNTASLQLLQEMEYLADLDEAASSVHLKFLMRNVKLLRELVLGLVVIINLVVLFSYRHGKVEFYIDIPSTSLAIDLNEQETLTLCNSLGVTLLVCLSLQTVVFLLTRGWLIVEQGWQLTSESRGLNTGYIYDNIYHRSEERHKFRGRLKSLQ